MGEVFRSCHSGTAGSVVSWEHWEADSIPGLVQWFMDPALLQVQHGLQLQLGSDPWPGSSMRCWVAKKKKKKKKRSVLVVLIVQAEGRGYMASISRGPQKGYHQVRQELQDH